MSQNRVGLSIQEFEFQANIYRKTLLVSCAGGLKVTMNVLWYIYIVQCMLSQFDHFSEVNFMQTTVH